MKTTTKFSKLKKSYSVKLDMESFKKKFKEAKVNRGFVVQTNGNFKSSGGVFDDIATLYKNDKRDFFQHEGTFFEYNEKTDSIFGAFVQKTKRGAGHGGVRLWDYNTIEDFAREGLRLSLGMGRKNSLAGLWWGGGKGLIAKNPNADYSNESFRDLLFGEYGKFVTSLKGCYYGAEDVGLTVKDTERMYRFSRFITCIPESIGGSGNPSHYTAKGTLNGMEAALEFLGTNIKGKKIVIQGAGNVASYLVEELIKKDFGSLVVSDINPSNLKRAQEKYKDKRIKWVQTQYGDNSILSEECDILAPCALGGIINQKTIPTFKTKIICGAANNQLLDFETDDMGVVKRNILYVPDFLNNRMGIVNCANEPFGYVDQDPAKERHFSKDWKYSIYNTTLQVLKESKSKNVGTDFVAKKMADELADELHPIFGHRSKDIISDLVKGDWVNKK